MESTAAHRTLASGEMLNWYRIDSVLGRGGFGVIYRATDTNLDHPVAIKEYIPAGCARRDGDTAVHPLTAEHGNLYRWGLERFIKEARNLVRFKHPNIVRVMSVFQQNNTAYMVMEYERGVDLARWLAAEGETARAEAALKRLIGPVCEGLAEVHRHGFIHRDIKPANILVRPDGSPVLLDFGSARDATLGNEQGLTALVTVGYAPLEQYDDNNDEQQGPWTDIYALGGVLYHAISGNDPVDSARRGSALLNGGRDPMISAATLGRGRYSAGFLAAIDWALEFRIADRPQALVDWMPALLGKSLVGERPDPHPALGAFADLGLNTIDRGAVARRAQARSDSQAPRTSRRDEPHGQGTQLGAVATSATTGRTVPDTARGTVRMPRTQRVVRRRRSVRRAIRWLPLPLVIAAALWWSADRDSRDRRGDAAVPSDEGAIDVATNESAAAEASDPRQDAQDAQDARAERVAELERRERAIEAREVAAQQRADAAAAERAATLEAERSAAEERTRRAAEVAENRRLETQREQAAQLADSSRRFTAALDEADAALDERRTAAARVALARAASTGFDGRRLEDVRERLDTIVAEMRRPVTDAEFDRVVRRFDGLKRAIEAKDRAVINALTQESEQNALFRQLMDSFEKLNMEITGIRVRNADKSVSANLRIRDMIRKNGDRAVPSDAFRDREITSRLVDDTWSEIDW